MPYTNPWDETKPPGTQNANTADDEFRKAKLDIRERMNDALVVDWSADPVVAKATLGGVNGDVLIYEDANSAGNKLSGELLIKEWLPVVFHGTTNSVGIVTINFNEFAPEHPWLVTDIAFAPPVSTIAFIFHLIRGIRTSDGAPLVGNIANYSEAGNFIELKMFFAESGAVVASQNIYVNLLLPMTDVK